MTDAKRMERTASSSSSDNFVDASEGTASPVTPTRKATIIPNTKNVQLKDVQTTEAELKTELIEIRHALAFFLNSRMVDAEELCLKHANTKLYYSLGYTMIQCIKALMTFEPEDLNTGIDCCKATMNICNLLIKSLGFRESFTKALRGASSQSTFASMTAVERHAELVQVECLLLKAVIGIVHSGDFFAFVREALNLRAAYATYMAFSKWLAANKAEALADKDLASGIQLGVGTISLILSLLPGKALNLMSVFGFEGNRQAGLSTLLAPGHWEDSSLPFGIPKDQEGLRRPICDAILLAYYLCISALLPVGKLDLDLPSRILETNLERYPNGSFWLWYGGRLRTMQTEGEQAVVQYTKSIESQAEYVQLHHICYWDIATTQLGLGDARAAHEAFDKLYKRSKWSEAVYGYSTAVSLFDSDPTPAEKESIVKIMTSIPNTMQRIAGKTIPVEKFTARKSKKFLAQGNRLMLPALELAFILTALSLAPVFKIQETHLVKIERELDTLNQIPQSERKIWSADGWYDDFCLLHMLRGSCLRLLAFPESFTHHRNSQQPFSADMACKSALESFEAVFANGRNINLDHYIVWFTHYECGKLYECMNDIPNAKKHYQMILNPKQMATSQHSKGKVSLQNAVVLRASSALDLLSEQH